MCDPVTLLVASTAVAAGGSMMAGNSASNQARQEGAQLNLQASQTRDEGVQVAQRYRKKAAFDRGTAVAQSGASGIEVGSGSGLAVEQYILQGGEEDALMTLLNADRRGRALDQQADMTRKAGQQAKRASMINAAGSLISGGAKMPWGGGGASAGPAVPSGYRML